MHAIQQLIHRLFSFDVLSFFFSLSQVLLFILLSVPISLKMLILSLVVRSNGRMQREIVCVITLYTCTEYIKKKNIKIN